MKDIMHLKKIQTIAGYIPPLSIAKKTPGAPGNRMNVGLAVLTLVAGIVALAGIFAWYVAGITPALFATVIAAPVFAYGCGRFDSLDNIKHKTNRAPIGDIEMTEQAEGER